MVHLTPIYSYDTRELIGLKTIFSEVVSLNNSALHDHALQMYMHYYYDDYLE